ncbi:MAG: endo alpha-1,4 polygalactosaminidase, partial [Epsilonproteobacteria bacterium]|nr:endo alpha-1,4 polygalactosaminidase [Campylobacterota bacterium]
AVKILSTLLLFAALLQASGEKRSAMLYYGKEISYTTVGVHDYIIVQPDFTNTYTHGFNLYKEKIYAYVSIGEISPHVKEFSDVKEPWKLTLNGAWESHVMDISNEGYQNFLFERFIDPLMARGFKHFFFDTLDSYQLAAKTPIERRFFSDQLAKFINRFHKRYPDSKLIINRGFEIIDKVHDSIEAVLFESYYSSPGMNSFVSNEVSKSDRAWLDTHLNKIKSYGIPIISVEYLSLLEFDRADELIKKIEAKGMIPYIGNRDLDIYGKSSKMADKRDILVFINESILDRNLHEVHRRAATPIEHLGYRLDYRDIEKSLPDPFHLQHYAGVVIWLDRYYDDPKKILYWAYFATQAGVKVSFASTFGFDLKSMNLSLLDIEVNDTGENSLAPKEVVYQDKMIGYEMNPSIFISGIRLLPKAGKPLLTYRDAKKRESTPAAIMPWGGYAIEEAMVMLINQDNIWII